VCFGSTVPTAFRTKVRSQVENSWERVANLDFSGWGTCPSRLPSGGLVVVNIDASIVVPGTTTVADGLATRPDNPATALTTVKFRNTMVSNKTFVHEFGHVLGWADQTTSTNPCTEITSGGTNLAWESDLHTSVMSQNNCQLLESLSPWDVLGTRYIYGQHPPGQITGVNGLDVAISGAQVGNNADVVAWRMLGGEWHGRFKRTATIARTLAAKTPNAIWRCLAVKGGVVGSGFTQIVAKDCAASAPQLFDFTNMSWLVMGNKCVHASSYSAGATLSIQECVTNTGQQRWDFFAGSNQIKLNGTNLCVTVPGGSTALGTRPTLQACDSSASNQVFVYSEDRIRFGDKCMNVYGGSAANGGAIVLWDGCDVVPHYHNAQFTIRGQIKAMGQCLTMQNDVAADGALIGVEPCSVTATQVWEYSW
jgi:hypothetical protein